MKGRPTKFKEEYIEQAYKLSLLGATDKQLCEYFSIDEKTLNNWKHKHPDFFQSIKRGKEEADFKVVKSLYKKACGDEKTPPDTTACIFWLKNRQPDKWRDKQDLNVDAKGINIVVGSDEDKELIEGI